jgi:hypothetical protein
MSESGAAFTVSLGEARRAMLPGAPSWPGAAEGHMRRRGSSILTLAIAFMDVDIRRAVRPILMAVLVYQFDGSFIL